MILKINTKDQKQISVAIKEDGKVVGSESVENEYGSQVLLPLIEKLLKKNKVDYKSTLRGKPLKMDYKELDGIEVETGPGSFTGLRVGVSVANALGFTLGIPVNGKKIETEIEY